MPSGLHWHGFDTPWRQDGVPYISGPPIEPGQSADYEFPAVPAGTRWMHSHFGLQEQDLLAAPLIVRETSAIKSGMQEIVIFLEDFSWTNFADAVRQFAQAEIRWHGHESNCHGHVKAGPERRRLRRLSCQRADTR